MITVAPACGPAPVPSISLPPFSTFIIVAFLWPAAIKPEGGPTLQLGGILLRTMNVPERTAAGRCAVPPLQPTRAFLAQLGGEQKSRTGFDPTRPHLRSG